MHLRGMSRFLKNPEPLRFPAIMEIVPATVNHWMLRKFVIDENNGQEHCLPSSRGVNLLIERMFRYHWQRLNSGGLVSPKAEEKIIRLALWNDGRWLSKRDLNLTVSACVGWGIFQQPVRDVADRLSWRRRQPYPISKKLWKPEIIQNNPLAPGIGDKPIGSFSKILHETRHFFQREI